MADGDTVGPVEQSDHVVDGGTGEPEETDKGTEQETILATEVAQDDPEPPTSTEVSDEDDPSVQDEFRDLLKKIDRGEVRLADSRQDRKRAKRVIRRLDEEATWLPQLLAGNLGDDSLERFQPLLRSLLKHAPDFLIWKMDNLGQTIMHILVTNSLYNAVTFLCNGSDLDPSVLALPDEYENNCIHWATRAANATPELAKFLIDRVNNHALERPNQQKNTPLHFAVDYEKCKKGQYDLVVNLLKRSKNPLTMENSEKRSPLQYHLHTKNEYFEKKERLRLEVERREAEARRREEERIEANKREEEMREAERNGANGALNGNAEAQQNPLAETTVNGGIADVQSVVDGEEQHKKKKGNNSSSSTKKTDKQNQQRRAEKKEAERKKAEIMEVEREAEAEKIEWLLRLECLRLNLDRDKTMRILYGENEARTVTFDLWGYKLIKADDLTNMELHLPFEKYLQYLVLPNLSIIPRQLTDWAELPASKGRKDYWWIFRWLRSREVEKIIRVVVHDRHPISHSDEIIEACLKGLGVEVWDWNKLDICPGTVQKAAPDVREITLYSSGSNAVLRSWSSPEGLVELENLEIVHLKVEQGLESVARTTGNIVEFQKNLQRSVRAKYCKHAEETDCAASDGQCRKIQIIPEIVDYDEDYDPLKSEIDPEQLEAKEPWLVCMENFAMFLKNYRKPGCEETKVAIIDDGVDAAHGSLSRNIADGESFSKGHGGLYSSYYKSTRGHGTIMATLIRKVCPDARLYVAKLDEKRTDNGLEITAESAVQAIRWAISRRVHVISMSWTINETTRNKDAIVKLKDAIYDAEKRGILLFCSVSDQGVKKDVAFPASLNNFVFRIGAATVYGDTWKWVGTDEADVDFILPGTRLRVDTRDPVAKSVKPCSGSSLATALAAGLAAVVLHCVALNDSDELELVRSRSAMKTVFESINKDGKGNYLRVWEVFSYKSDDDDDDKQSEIIGSILYRLLAKIRPSAPVVKATIPSAPEPASKG